MSVSKNTTSVSSKAKLLLTRLERSSKELSTTVIFKCNVCKDTGAIQQTDGKYKQCKSCPAESEEITSNFF